MAGESKGTEATSLGVGLGRSRRKGMIGGAHLSAERGEG
jgi:hypothetical protein